MIPLVTPVILRPELDGVQVWFANLEIDDGDLQTLRGTLDPEEQAQAARFAMKHLTRRFIASHAALRMLLGRRLGVPAEAVHFRYGTNGKPSLADEFCDREVTFNMSHSEDAAVLAIAQRGEIGIDLERTDRDLDFELLAASFFAPAEHHWLMSRPPDSRRQAFYVCWTAKEAYVKARGDGLSFALSDFEVLPGPEDDVLRLTVYQDPAEARRWKLSRFKLSDAWVGAVVLENCS